MELCLFDFVELEFRAASERIDAQRLCVACVLQVFVGLLLTVPEHLTVDEL